MCVANPDSKCPEGCCLKCETVDKENKYDYPPWVPHIAHKSLGGRTLAMSAVHADGKNTPEYNAHSLYGMMESMATNAAMSPQRAELSPVQWAVCLPDPA